MTVFSSEDDVMHAGHLSSVGLYMVRVGARPEVVAIQSGATQLQRGEEIVCRTTRGIEVGEVLAETESSYLDCESAGRYIRHTRPDDQLLWKQLLALSNDACSTCQKFLSDQGLPDVLLEVEPLIDGRTLYFHFLGEPSDATEDFVQELSDVYQKKVAASRFAKLLEHGCGPGCGTKEKAGCGTGGGCAVCAIAGGCTSK